MSFMPNELKMSNYRTCLIVPDIKYCYLFYYYYTSKHNTVFMDKEGLGIWNTL